MADSWKMKCLSNCRISHWTTGKEYEVKDGILICDDGTQFVCRKLESYDDFLSETFAEWELITDEPEQESWEMKCIDNGGFTDYFTAGKCYKACGGRVDTDNKDISLGSGKNFEEWKNKNPWGWELMITDKIAKPEYSESKEFEKIGEFLAMGLDYALNDAINPSHYKDSCSLECIEAMEMAYGKYWVYVFCITNAWKYIWRYKNKNGEQDIKKARWYVDKAKELEEGAGEWEGIESVLTRIECENLWW